LLIKKVTTLTAKSNQLLGDAIDFIAKTEGSVRAWAGSQAILTKKGGYAIPLTVKIVSPLA
jgi:hypothetical protein